MSSLAKIPATAIVAASLICLSACSGAGGAKPAISESVEKVNGVPISRAELDRAVKSLLAQQEAPAAVAPETMKKVTDAALDQLVAAELLYQAARALPVQDLDKQVSARILQSKYQYPSEAEFEKALRSVGMTSKDLQEAARKDIIINNFIKARFASAATVSEAEVKKFYDDNREKSFTHPERVHVSDIMIAIAKDATPAARTKAKEKAEAILKRVKAGEPFAEVAKKESDLPNKDRGGDIGIIEKRQSIPAFEKAAFSLKPGEVSAVVETQFGYHIIKAAERMKPSTDKYQEVKGKIAGLLKREKIRGLVARCVEDLRSKAKIEKG